MNYTLVQTDEDIINLRKYLYNEKILKIAMDFECEFNLHSYGEKLCLIQVFDGKKFFIIDPFKVSNEEIIKFLEFEYTTKIMYGVESDINLIYSQYGVLINNIFDQKIIIDILQLKYNGLNYVLKHFLNIEIKDKEKYQKFDWTKRPINKFALQYALNDVKYLLDLSNILIEQIRINNKDETLIYKLIKKNYLPKNNKKPGIFIKKEYKALSDNDKLIFKEIYEIREFYAKKFNIPPFHLINNNVLFEIINKTKDINEINISKNIPVEKQVEIKEKIKNKLIEKVPNFA
jgi:ribonuclease D